MQFVATLGLLKMVSELALVDARLRHVEAGAVYGHRQRDRQRGEQSPAAQVGDSEDFLKNTDHCHETLLSQTFS